MSEEQVTLFGVVNPYEIKEISSSDSFSRYLFIYKRIARGDGAIGSPYYSDKNIILNQEERPWPYRKGAVRLYSFSVRDFGHQLWIELEVDAHKHNIFLINNKNLNRSCEDFPVITEWDIKRPVFSVLKAIEEIDTIGIGTWKERTRLQRFHKYIIDRITIENERFETEKAHADFLLNNLQGEYDNDDYVFNPAIHWPEEIDMPTSSLSDNIIITKLLDNIKGTLHRLKLLREKRIEPLRVIDYHKNHLITATIKEGVTEIPCEQFYSYRKLTELVLPKSLKTIGANAFSFCSALKKVIILSEMPPNILPGNGETWYKHILVPKANLLTYRKRFMWRSFHIQSLE